MEHFLNTSTNTSHHQLPHYSYMGFNPFTHLYQQDLFQENTNNNTLFASLFNEVPQEALISLGYNHEYEDPSCYFHNEGLGFCEEGGYNNNNDNGIVEHLNCEMGCEEKELSTGGKSKHSEKQRREDSKQKYTVLMSLLPNRTKGDRASVVGGAIEYIKELLQTVNHLKSVVDRKKRLIDRTKKLKTDPENVNDSDLNLSDDHDKFCNGCSWIQRKSKDTEVDVKVVNDEVNIKLVQLRKSNCLIPVSKILDELQLDVHHVAGGCIGDLNSFMFNTKLCEGASSVHASAIANKLIEGVGTDNAYCSTPVPPSFC